MKWSNIVHYSIPLLIIAVMFTIILMTLVRENNLHDYCDSYGFEDYKCIDGKYVCYNNIGFNRNTGEQIREYKEVPEWVGR